jgi:intein/homing endonuclease
MVGDLVKTSNGWNKVQHVFDKRKKKAYRITLKSGKQIVCSAEHLFPTVEGVENNIIGGLRVGNKIFSII